MGSLWGHLDEGVVFAALGLWWLFNLFQDYVKAEGKERFVSQISYTARIRGKEVPIETGLKLFFSVGGFLIEFFNDGVNIYDKEGNFIRVGNIQHMSIYCLFITHSILDLLRYLRLFYIDGLDYFTFSASFLWYGTIFHFHTQYKSDLLETIVHTNGLLWCFASGLALWWEARTQDKFLPCYCRAVMVLGLGTWFIHTPFLLFSTDSFPGENMNPRWKRDSPENYQVVATLFGFHLCFNIVLSLVIYAVISFVYNRRRLRETIEFRRIPNGETDNFGDCEETALLSEEEL